ncbi:MAG: hypothetical protein R3245_04555, partial [Kiloniellales bacterium]|nr:hypothetical protein [Kiloniellales bacterium]
MKDLASMGAGPLLLCNAAMPEALMAAPGNFMGRECGDLICGDLLVKGGKLAGFVSDGQETSALKFDLGGRIITPRLTEAHCHLDKCHTIGRLRSVGGDLASAISLQREDRIRATRSDIGSRVERGLSELLAAGCDTVRSHVDWDSGVTPEGDAPAAWEVMNELGDEFGDDLQLQLSALLSLEDFERESYMEALARRLAHTGAALGVFVHNQARMLPLLQHVFRLADRFGLSLDFHVDEGLDPSLDGLQRIADTVLEMHYEGPVLCGHACSLMNLSGDDLDSAVER